MRGAHSERKPVRREFGLVLGHSHVHMNGRACSFVRAGALRMCTVRSANPTLYEHKNLSGLFEKFPKV